MATHAAVEPLPHVLSPIKEHQASDASTTSTEDIQSATTDMAMQHDATDDLDDGVQDAVEDIKDIQDSTTQDSGDGDSTAEDSTTHDVVVSFHVDSDATFQVTTANVLTKFKVSACSIATASPVWRKVLYGQDAVRPASGDWVLEVDGDLKALDIMFRIIHYQFSKVPSTLPLDDLFELMLLTGRFKCTHLVFPWARKWISAFTSYACEKDHLYHCHKVAWIAWELGNEKLFQDMVYAMIVSSKVDTGGDLLNIADSPLKEMILPPGIIDLISATRASTIEKLLAAVKAPVEALTYGKRDPGVRYCKIGKDIQECEAMLLGSAIPALVQSGLYPVPSATDFSGSINQLTNTLQSIKFIAFTSANWQQIQGHQHCNLGFRESAQRCVEEITPISLGDEHIDHLKSQAEISGVNADFDVPENQTQKFQVGNFVYKDTWIDPRERVASQRAMIAQSWNSGNGKESASDSATGFGW
ncbi:hypothetical protein SLS62_002924 [Diatrype stigma]|uniref:BTB domain-containing protein n=1 Tax=Diatrype stigma TaxID=117547 RepID=A0AAN9UTA8_9PEZI